jgi:hypothetical protein
MVTNGREKFLSRHLLGCVDGIRGNELHGWIMNKDDPQRPEPIICSGPNQETHIAYPFTFRKDVVQATGVDGVFNFAIPLALLRSLGRTCSISHRFGFPLDHGAQISLPELSRPCQYDTPLNIFLHIPKTAGTSLRNTLLRTVPASEVMLIYPCRRPGKDKRFHRIPLSQRNHLTWLFGHCHFGFFRYVTKSSRYITFAREPMARLRSNVTHHIAADTDFDLSGIRIDIETMFNEGLSEEFDNVLTRSLAGLGRDDVPLGQVGDDEVELAITNVRRHFCFVGQQSRAREDTCTLQDFLGLPADELSADNVTPQLNDEEYSTIKMLDRDKVSRRNRPDQLLYARLEQEGLFSTVLEPSAIKASV